MKKSLMMAALVPFLWACEDTTGPEGPGQVAVRFQAVTSAGASASQAPDPRMSFDHLGATTGAITLEGTNGTLVIQDIRLIVSEIELERVDAECVAEEDEDECEEFEGGPFLVNLLDGTAADVVTAVIPAGTYTEFEFEVEDLDIEEDDDDSEQQTLQTLLGEVRNTYENFPSDASMVVHGTFNGEPFTVYFAAEIEVEREFATPFQVPEDGAILVNLSPEVWFTAGDQVVDLLALNGQTVEFEAEFENGVLEVEDEDDEDDEDEDEDGEDGDEDDD